jgi:hypothetical protein
VSGNSKVWGRNGSVHRYIPNMTAQTRFGDVTVNVTVAYCPGNAARLALKLLISAFLVWAFDEGQTE